MFSSCLVVFQSHQQKLVFWNDCIYQMRKKLPDSNFTLLVGFLGLCESKWVTDNASTFLLLSYWTAPLMSPIHLEAS